MTSQDFTVDPLFGERLRAIRTERGLSLRALAARAYSSKSHLHEFEVGEKQPTPDVARRLDEALQAGGELAGMVQPMRRWRAVATEPWETADLLRRLQASDTTPATIEQLHGTVFELCCEYGWRNARELRVEGHGWLREVARLLGRPVGLRQHQELLCVAGWLALLVGCVEYDLGMRGAAEATRVAARQLGDEAGHGEIVAWSWEMSSWFALTQGRYRDVVAAAEAGQSAVGDRLSVVQLIAQEAKARARLGDLTGVHKTLERGHNLLTRFPTPDRPDNHFVVDPDKWDFYAMDAYRLAGEDQLAEHHARQVLALSRMPDGTERAPMRATEARLTLAAIAARAQELEQAVDMGLEAFNADRRSLPSLLMVANELDSELRRRYPGEQAADEFHHALQAIAR